MSSDSQPRLRLDPPLAQVDVPFRTRVDNLNVHALMYTRSNVGCDDDESIGMSWVPYAFLWWVAECWQVELDG